MNMVTKEMDMTLFTWPKAPKNNNNNNNNNIMYLHHQAITSNGLSPPESGDPCPAGGNKWAKKILRECARAISDKDSGKIHHLLWMINELSSPYGDSDQKLGSYFLQALFCKATDSGRRCFRTLTSVAEKGLTFDSALRLILKFQEASPWTTFGHVASNGAILEALDGEARLHIVDVSNTLCTQWPTLLESLATRSDDTPRLRLTVVVTRGGMARCVIRDVGQRMEKFARLMGVPFEFRVVGGVARLGDLTREALGVEDGEAVAVNCMGALRRVAVEERGAVVRFLRTLNPRVVTVVEEEADMSTTRHDFVKCFEECLRFYTTYFEMLEDTFPPTSNERLALERECSRSIVRVLACNHGDHHDREVEQEEEDHGHDQNNNDNATSVIGECERRERGIQWSERLKEAFSPFGFSDDVIDDVKALLKRYRTGWGLVLPQQDQQQYGAYLSWKDEPVVWASAWKP